MRDFLAPVVLEGRHVRLEPLRLDHVDALRAAAADGELWKLWYTSVPTPEATADYVAAALAMQAEGSALPFVVRLRASGEIVGSTRYCNAHGGHGHLEIGYTWYARRVQRSGVNTETKALLLAHAFEQLRCIRVELRTHWMNQASRAAIARLGARQEGVLRNHQRLADGSFRDTVVFSIIESEWLAVKRHLAFKLEQGNNT
jgi:N-acetyltransferase